MRPLILATALVVAITAPAAGESKNFYNANGSFAGSSVRGQYYDGAGRFSGSSVRQGNSTRYYDHQGRYSGSTVRR